MRVTIAYFFFSVAVLVAALYYSGVEYESKIEGRWWLGEKARQQRIQSWFNDPRAVYYGSRFYVGFTDMNGRVGIETRNQAGKLFDTKKIGHLGNRADDHASPALHVRPDGRLVAAWGEHTGSLTVAISKKAGDAASWTSTIVGRNYYSYAHLVESSENLYLFSRRHVGPVETREAIQTFRISVDGGLSWGDERTLISSAGRTPYLKVARGKSVIHLAFTDDHPDWGISSVYYAALVKTRLLDAAGELLVSKLPIIPDTSFVVWDARQSGQRAWLWDVLDDATSGPVIAFTTFDGGDPDSISSKGAVGDHGIHRYRIGTWERGEWKVEEVCAAGAPMYPREPAYSGGISIISRDSVIVSREIHGSRNLWLYVRRGSSWNGKSLNGLGGFRPYVIRDSKSRVQGLSWLTGNYVTYREFDTTISVSPTVIRGMSNL